MSKNGQLTFLRIIELGGALGPRGSPPQWAEHLVPGALPPNGRSTWSPGLSPPMGGALGPRDSPPLGGALRFCSVYETETSLLNLKA